MAYDICLVCGHMQCAHIMCQRVPLKCLNLILLYSLANVTQQRMQCLRQGATMLPVNPPPLQITWPYTIASVS